MSYIDSKNSTRYSEYSYKAKAEIAKQNASLNSRELQMLPTYLELAKIDGNYRFNKEEIALISKTFKHYSTNLSLVDLLKDLLSVGSDVKNYLSAKEIIGFLEATNDMKMVEQRNVLRFLKVAKIKEGTKITPEYIMEQCPYEKFRASEINISKKYNLWDDKFSLNEDDLKSRYEMMINNQMLTLANEGYRKVLSANKCPVSEYITKNNKPVVETVAKCSNPEVFFSIVDITGINPNVLATSDALIDMYSVSGKNNSLIVDMSRAFYPAEIKQIARILLENAKNSGHKVLPELVDYTGNTYKIYDTITSTVSMPKLSTQRKNVVKELGLQDKVKLLPLSKYEDVYASSMYGERGKNIQQGNFERGRKK